MQQEVRGYAPQKSSPGQTNGMLYEQGGVFSQIKSETIRHWLCEMQERFPNDQRLTQLAHEIESDVELEKFFLKLIQNSAEELKTPESAAAAREFFRTHPDWWSQNFESIFETLEKNLVSVKRNPIDDAQLQVSMGIVKGTYKFGKGLITGIWDLLKYGYDLATDEKTQAQTGEVIKQATTLFFVLQFGPPEAAAQARQKVIDAAQKVFDGICESMKKQWEEAERNGTQAELISEWTTRGVWEVGTLVISVAKAAKVAEVGALAKTGETINVVEKGASASSTVSKSVKGHVVGAFMTLSKGVNFDRRTTAWGRKLMLQMENIGLKSEPFFVDIRMQRYQKYRNRLKGIQGVSGSGEFYRGTPKISSFPVADAHPRSIASPVGRWHLPGEKSVYFGNSKSGTVSELAKHYKDWSKTIDVSATKIKYRNALDLTDPAVLKRLGISEKALYGGDLSHGQVISSIARSEGFDAIISRSAANSGKTINLTLLRKELTP